MPILKKINTEKPWRTLSSKIVYKNQWITVREDKVLKPDGSKGIYDMVDHNKSSVYIVALTPKKEVYLIRQYRYPTKVFSWEVPGGVSKGNKPLVVAQMELKEEAGFQAKKWTYIGRFQVQKGLCTEWGHIFTAENLFETAHEQSKESITGRYKVPFKKVLKMIDQGEITDGMSIVALIRASMRLEL